jgi:hypothetical protein
MLVFINAKLSPLLPVGLHRVSTQRRHCAVGSGFGAVWGDPRRSIAAGTSDGPPVPQGHHERRPHSCVTGKGGPARAARVIATVRAPLRSSGVGSGGGECCWYRSTSPGQDLGPVFFACSLALPAYGRRAVSAAGYTIPSGWGFGEPADTGRTDRPRGRGRLVRGPRGASGGAPYYSCNTPRPARQVRCGPFSLWG